MKTVTLATSYSVSADDLWKIVTSYDALGKIAGRAISFRGLPEGEFEAGQSIEVSISLLGLLPRQEYHINILERDDEFRVIKSSEHGAGVKVWQHTLVVSESADGCTLVDIVNIQAGWLTLPAALWAKFIYRRRHVPRLRLLEAAAHAA